MHPPTTGQAIPSAWALLLWMAVLGGCEAFAGADEVAPATGTPEAGGEPAAVAECAAGPVERRPLVLPDGRHAYVEPENLMRVGKDLVVAGSPTYTWDVGGAGPVRPASSGAHVAAYLGAAPRLVPVPLDVPIGVVRTVALDERRWGMLFTEALPADDGSAEPGTIASLRYAEYDGARWSPVESVPLPAQGRLAAGSSSPLVRSDGTLSWAVVRNPEGEALLYDRRAGTWSVETVVDRGIEAAGLATGPTGIWLALSGLDEAISEPRKSVRLFRRDGGWRLVSRDPATRPYTEVRAPSVVALPAGVTVTWTEAVGAGLARARVGAGLDDSGTLVTLDASAPAVRVLETPEGEPAWVSWHAGAVPGTSELRLLHAVGDSVEVDRSTPYPYTGFHAATVLESGEVVVTGPEFSPDPARPTVRSLTLRFNPSCR